MEVVLKAMKVRDQMHVWNTTNENGVVLIGSRHEAQCLYLSQLEVSYNTPRVHWHP
jgi:hypothetical protein